VRSGQQGDNEKKKRFTRVGRGVNLTAERGVNNEPSNAK